MKKDVRTRQTTHIDLHVNKKETGGLKMKTEDLIPEVTGVICGWPLPNGNLVECRCNILNPDGLKDFEKLKKMTYSEIQKMSRLHKRRLEIHGKSLCGPPMNAMEQKQLMRKFNFLDGSLDGSLYRKKKKEKEKIPAGLRAHVLYKYKKTCQLCGRKAPQVVLHVDHIIPESKGGKTDLSNLQVLCETCNLGKGDRYSE